MSINANAYRCGADIFQNEDLKISLLDACGEATSKELIGYVDGIETKTGSE